MENVAKIIGLVVIALGGVLLFAILAIIPVYFAWNNFFVPVLSMKNIDIVQAAWLSLFIGCFRSSSLSSK
jgi:hypothetical protein